MTRLLHSICQGRPTADCGQSPTCCLLYSLKAKNGFTFFKGWKKRYISIVLVLILKFRFSVHKVLLEHRHAHSSIHCLQLLWCDKGRSEYLWQGPSGPQNLKYLQSGLWWKVCQTLTCVNDSRIMQCATYDTRQAAQAWNLSPCSGLASTLCTLYLGQHVTTLLHSCAFLYIRDCAHTDETAGKSPSR